MSNEERRDEMGAYVASSAWEDLSGRMTNGRPTLKIYDEVAARTWQQQNSDGASSADGVSEHNAERLGDGIRAPELCLGNKKNNNKETVRCVASVLALCWPKRRTKREIQHIQHHSVFTMGTF